MPRDYFRFTYFLRKIQFTIQILHENSTTSNGVFLELLFVNIISHFPIPETF